MEREDHQATQQANLSSTVKDLQSDMIYFKDEVLRDMRKLELQAKGHTDKKSTELDKRLIAMESLATQLVTKVNAFSTSMTESNSKVEKIDKLASILTKLEDRLNLAESKTSIGLRELSEYNYKYEKLIVNNLLVPGFIGDRCKHPNLREYILWVNTQLASLNTFKEKQTLDLKSYKDKLEKSFNTFNSAIDRVKATFIENCKESVSDCETGFNERIKSTEDLIGRMRMENNTYALNLRNDLSSSREEWKKMITIKEELSLKFEKEVEQFKEESSKNIERCTKFQNEYKLMKAKFVELSEFIKDVRFRANLKGSLNRREFLQMSNKINFKKKNTMGLSQNQLNSIDTELLLHTNKNEDLSMTQRRDTKSATDLIGHKPDFFDQLTKDEIKLFSLYREKNKMNKGKGGGGAIDNYADNRSFNNQTISLLKKAKLVKDIDQEGNNITNLLMNKKTPPKKTLTNSLGINGDCKVLKIDSSKIAVHHQKDQSDSKANCKLLENKHLRDKERASLHQQNSSKHNINQEPRALNDTSQLLLGNQEDPHSNRTISHLNHTLIKPQLSGRQPSELRNDHYEKKIKQIDQEQQTLMSDVFSKLSATDVKMSYLEQETSKKLEAIHQQFKRFFSQFIDEDKTSGSKLRILKYPAGIFVPSNFDGRNLDNYFPSAKRSPNQSLSTKSRAIQKQLTKTEYDTILYNTILHYSSFLYQANQLKAKISPKDQLPSSSNMHQTFYSLSVLMNNNKLSYCSNEEANLIKKDHFNSNKRNDIKQNIIN